MSPELNNNCNALHIDVRCTSGDKLCFEVDERPYFVWDEAQRYCAGQMNNGRGISGVRFGFFPEVPQGIREDLMSWRESILYHTPISK